MAKKQQPKLAPQFVPGVDEDDSAQPVDDLVDVDEAAETLEQAQARFTDALWSGKASDSQLIARLRDTDEWNPRGMLPLFRTMIEVVPQLRRIIADREGIADKVAPFDRARRALQRQAPAADESVEAYTERLQTAEDNYQRAFRERGEHEAADLRLGEIINFCPRLFLHPKAAAIAKTADFETVMAKVMEILNWPAKHKLTIETRDGWEYSIRPHQPKQKRIRIVSAPAPINRPFSPQV